MHLFALSLPWSHHGARVVLDDLVYELLDVADIYAQAAVA